MNNTITRLKYIFLGLFVLAAAASAAYQIFWVKPAKQCEATGAWWDPRTRICATPLYIPNLTGRPEGMSRKDWSLQQAAKVQADEYNAKVEEARELRALGEKVNAERAAAAKAAGLPPPTVPGKAPAEPATPEKK